MILQLFKRSLKEHFGFHLLIPVLLILLISAWGDDTLRDGSPDAWLNFIVHWPMSHLGQLAEVYLAFFLVVGWSIKLAGDVQSTRVETLRDLLPGATRYFAIGVIPVREWFEPNTAVYLATVIHQQNKTDGFAHERVLLFMRNSDLKAVSVSYLDEPYAKALAAIHKEFEIPLAYMTPSHYVSLMRGLSREQRRTLGVERKVLTWLRSRVAFIPEAWTLRAIAPFVLLGRAGDQHDILRFDKHGRTLTLSAVDDPAFVAAAKVLVERISATVYSSGTKTLKERHNFISYLQL